jgi:hypothetical protein
MKEKAFAKIERFDQKPGYVVVTPTTMRYFEADGSDLRVKRIRLIDPSGKVEKTFLQDEMGVLFADLPDVRDDLDYYAQGEVKNLAEEVL